MVVKHLCCQMTTPKKFPNFRGNPIMIWYHHTTLLQHDKPHSQQPPLDLHRTSNSTTLPGTSKIRAQISVRMVTNQSKHRTNQQDKSTMSSVWRNRTIRPFFILLPNSNGLATIWRSTGSWHQNTKPKRNSGHHQTAISRNLQRLRSTHSGHSKPPHHARTHTRHMDFTAYNNQNTTTHLPDSTWGHYPPAMDHVLW